MAHQVIGGHRRDPLSDVRRLTNRDRQILAWLAEHYVLTTDQIARSLFSSYRYAQQRLSVLHRIEAVSRFTFPLDGGGFDHYRYSLGRLGVLLHPTPYGHPDNPRSRPPKTLTERRARIMASPRLNHLLGANDFFIGLHAHARRHPGRRLRRWWSEQRTADAFASYPGAGIRPDGHGVWSNDGATVGFFLEHDTGTEPLGRVIAKLDAYGRLAALGPRYPVLLWLPTRRREANLLRALAHVALPTPVAAAVHGNDPAEPIWAMPTQPDHRLCLHQLPSDHGSDSALNPARFHADPDEETATR